jgi:4'-phosphopantetheinyl transferase
MDPLPPTAPPGPEEVHLWRIDLDCPAASVAALRATLVGEELERAARFHSQELRERWTVAHGALRCILAAYSAAAPNSLVLRAGPQGKPALVGVGENISFNLTHTGGLALLAIARSGRIGVDAEIVRPGVDVVELSRRFFAPAEAGEILGLPPDVQLEAFFACWTRKEAFIKALGSGLSTPLHRFQVSVRHDQPARLISVDWEDAAPWTLVDIGEPGIAATLAIDAASPVLRHRLFTPPSV